MQELFNQTTDTIEKHVMRNISYTEPSEVATDERSEPLVMKKARRGLIRCSRPSAAEKENYCQSSVYIDVIHQKSPFKKAKN